MLADGASWTQIFAHAAFVGAEAIANSLVALLLRNVIMTARAQTIALRRAEVALRDNVVSLETRAQALADDRTAALVEAEANTRELAARLERGVTQLVEDLAPVTDGDLTVRPTISAEAGEVAVVADFTGVLITSFADVARLVRDAATRAQVNSDHLSARVGRLTHAVQERAVQVNETAAGAEHIADSATDVLSAVEQVNRATHEAVTSVEHGNTAVSQTLERMNAMRATMIGATRQIKRLSDSSLAMNSTVGLVLQFAGDLELLADNAQIEAARHSEAGGVFTAVAEQTGRLAEDAQKALSDIQSAVLANRQETAEVGRRMEQMASEVVSSARGRGRARLVQRYHADRARARYLRGAREWRGPGPGGRRQQSKRGDGTDRGVLRADGDRRAALRAGRHGPAPDHRRPARLHRQPQA